MKLDLKPDFEKQELIPAIIQDFQTKEVLMLAYVNEESYKEMLRTKQTCFYSRSRKKLWKKGETSGNIQEIKGMYLDCDKDTLLIYVKQTGGACHTGEYSCFFNEIIPYQDKEKEILEEMYATIQDRVANPMEKSYTNYLLAEGVDKICKKIGEEASETIIAAKNEDKDELIGEISDLVYHTLVLMFYRKVTLTEIEEKLKQRHQKQGNKKEFYQKGEY
ncbi:MAG TPA: bifunctional phosphoribosyl-AMP cyclohydrolase/phosphoribosyl-ATP diphosphatase HisIE [Candidatus Merdicola faecigallinarum]|uniref:Histidine biosynthesis bifunctional protein HisIE n=1 Tax=Candidatus Merdicola faecigallinarum TaxID=2840862 RepID=A0A9D1M0U7_9FIRM|nr:bifunctional phosphoribosyl-AMP cyclohydrolase/phosphoribosyl-ATP diphosphatase HisIE [Candidatus Merdicola faecigallinarum]